MNKKACVVLNLVLLAWFFLDMVGVKIGDQFLVTRSYKEDGVYFLIFLIFFICFVFKERIGKYLLTVWLSLWFLAQFFSHWYFTLFGPSEGKMSFFADTVKLISSSNVYIPDLYHIVLHVLIIIALINMIFYCINSNKVKKDRAATGYRNL